LLAFSVWCSSALPQPADAQGVLRLLPTDSVTEKSITLADKRTLPYTATAGTLTLHDQAGEKIGAIFYTAYVAKGADRATRPVTFAFNGGPGAASAYLHLGLAGPRLVEFGPQGNDGAAAKLVDNPDTWLAFTDLVFIDPLATGWSRTIKPEAANAFFNVRRDAEMIAKVIARYVANNSRTTSPKYLLGESYGGFRAAKVARAMQIEQGLPGTGIVMVSPMLDTALQWAGASNPFGAALHFPSLAAAELDRTRSYTPERMAEIERFALNEYLPALAGTPPTGERAAQFYGTIAKMTGLPVETVEKSRGYVRAPYLAQLRARGQVASSYDGAFLMPDPYPDSDARRGGDPVLDGFTRALSGAFAGYARDELGFKTEITYVLLADVAGKWEWGDRRNPPGISDDIRTLLAFDPSFRMLVAHGRSDLVTPHGVTRYVLDNIPPIGGAGRVQFKLHRGGHMFYFDAAARKAFTRETAEFFGRGM
jgi:carboxypeptidase C (cathepsin A)